MTFRRSARSGSSPLIRFARVSKRRGIGIVRRTTSRLPNVCMNAEGVAAATARTMSSEVQAERSVARLKRWVVDQALPLWGQTGFDSARGSFVERLTFEGAPLLWAPRGALGPAPPNSFFFHPAPPRG